VNLKDFDGWLKNLIRPAVVMGVLNVTPDSFSDGGQFNSEEQAAAHAFKMIEEGADWIDIGGESTRPGAARIGAEEQIRRAIPVVKAIRQQSDILISIDTTQSEVADRALDMGADVVNDISAGREDPKMFSSVARRKAGIILMHMQGSPGTMQLKPTYENVTAEVSEFLLERRNIAEEAGISKDRILFDPGLGFGKALSHNLQLMRETSELAALGQPLVVGPSRKSFIGEITGETDPKRRIFGTAAACVWCAMKGAAVVRVHDVLPIVQVLRMVRGIEMGKSLDFPKK
jgi:dihydropteroate synthase